MRRTYNKGDINKLNRLFVRPLSPLSEEQFNKLKASMYPESPNDNEILLKKTIELFYQATPIIDFDPAEQYQKLQNIPINQQRFCTLLTYVVLKKTKDKVDWAKNFLILKSKKIPIEKEEQEKEQQQQPKPMIQSPRINRHNFLCDILINIKMACSRLQQLLYKMIYLHLWKCQSKNNCKQTYMEGYLAKLLFKKIIGPSGIFDADLESFKAFFEQQKQKESKQNNDLESKGQEFQRKRLMYPIQPGFETLKNEILRWGPQLLGQVVKQKNTSTSIDQKPSLDNKFFICKTCFCRQYNIESTDVQKKKNKKKNKSKANSNSSNKTNLNASQSQESNEASRKGSCLQFQEQTTTQEIDEQLNYQNQKYFEKISNFLEDFKIDPENRADVRLEVESDDDDDQVERKSNKLKTKMKSILYKSFR